MEDADLFGVPLWIVGLVCLVPAAVFLYVWPRRDVVGARFLLLRWGHSATWILLSVACFARVLIPGEVGGQVARYAALAGFATYLGFLAVTRRAPIRRAHGDA